jgi:hypothetical protein
MNPMLSALKGRRSGHAEEQPKEESGGGGMKSFVEQLSPEAKAELLQHLAKDVSGASAEQIAKGAPTKAEQAKIADQANQDNAIEEMEEQGEGPAVDSDKIAMGMLDSRFKNSQPSKPRNLHERVQTNMAKDLKAKGKI